MSSADSTFSKFLKLFKELLIYSNVFVSLCVASLTSVTFLLYGVHDIRVILLSFFSTLSYYNFLRLFKLSEYQKGLSPLSRWVVDHKLVTSSLGVLGLGMSVFLLWAYPFRNWWYFSPLFFLALFYTLPLRFGSYFFQLRELPGLKIFLIAFMWTFATVRLPLSLVGAQDQPFLWLMELLRFLFILAITIPFDIRDLAYDRPHLMTIPQHFGTRTSKWIAAAALIGFLLISLILQREGVLSTREWWASAMTASVSVGMISISGKGRGEWFYGFFIEGLSLLYFLFLFLIYVI